MIKYLEKNTIGKEGLLFYLSEDTITFVNNTTVLVTIFNIYNEYK